MTVSSTARLDTLENATKVPHRACACLRLPSSQRGTQQHSQREQSRQRSAAGRPLCPVGSVRSIVTIS